MSVKVGVRVRPFNKRQQQLNSKCCVEMNGTTTYLKVPDSSDTKTFVFDYSFWSHDKYIVDADGISQPIDGQYADQKKVYQQIGSDILINAWQGYNCCLFAYGQTGSGKSYSMLGYGPNRGVIPMVCDNIFGKITKDTDKTHSYEVKVSMMEIYNETLRDLLSKSKKQQDLKICESKTLGVYVEGLVKHSVHSYKQIDQKIEQGSNNRSIAATLMNQSSSRSHTIVSITFVQKIQVSTAQTSVKYSTIYLVDLAGSQSVGKTGVDSKDRLREAAKINQSLSTLGRVIQILAQNSGRTTDKIFVPYRDSKLTFILRNALGGNSRTAMICAISPADDNYEQTLSTLRYANRAKKIQNKATVNQSDVDKLIRMLREQNQMLKKMLKQAKFNKTIINTQMMLNVQQMNKNMADFGLLPEYDIDNEYNDNESIHDSNGNISFIDQSILEYDDKVDEKLPYITNLSEDQLLSYRLKYSCATILRIGNKYGNPRPEVVLAALGIQPLHCQIRNQNGKLFIQALDEQASDYTFLNGNSIPKARPEQLYNYDRLVFGTGSIFVVKIPQGLIRKTIKDNVEKQLKAEDIDYVLAITEMQQNHISGGLSSLDKNKKVQLEEEQIRKKVLEEIQSQYDKIKQLKEQEMRSRLVQQQKQYQERIKQIQKEKGEEAARLNQQLEKQSFQAHKLRSDKQKVQEEIIMFRELEKKLEQSSHTDKEALEQARSALQQKIQTISSLETSLLQIEHKQHQMKEELEKKEIVVQKQLQIKMILCNNENILNDYKLELSKKIKNTNELKELLVKKERIQMQKQLVQLVPMVEKFNLIAKQMNKNIEAGLSIDYCYISEAEAIQVLKNNSYKNKLKISIHIFNKDQKRSYFWSIDAFKNRFQIALSLFEYYLRNQKEAQATLANNQTDPYWDPTSPQLVGIAFVSLQALFYRLEYQGQVSVVRKGEKVGKMKVRVWPTDVKRTKNISDETLTGMTIFNPRDFIEKTLSIVIEVSELCLEKQYLYSNLQLEYTLITTSYKNLPILSPLIPPENFLYSNFHTLTDLSQTVIVQYLEQPLAIKVYAQFKDLEDDNLTIRGDQDYMEKDLETRSLKGSFADTSSVVSEDTTSPKKVISPLKKSFNNGHSGIIVSNFDVMSKIQLEFNKQKQDMKKKEVEQNSNKNEKKPKAKGKGKDDCVIF